MINKYCDICREIQAPDKSILYKTHLSELFKSNGLNSRFLFNNGKFIITPSVGPVSECHLIIIPSIHVHSFALLDTIWLQEAEQIISAATKIVKNTYGNCIIFEHGVISDTFPGSSSCSHAHMHLISCSAELKPYLQEDGLRLKKIDGIKSLNKYKLYDKPYFYYQNNLGNEWIMEDTIKKSQYIRILLSKLNGFPEKGIWQNNIGEIEVLKTAMSLKNKFQELLCSSLQ